MGMTAKYSTFDSSKKIKNESSYSRRNGNGWDGNFSGSCG